MIIIIIIIIIIFFIIFFSLYVIFFYSFFFYFIFFYFHSFFYFYFYKPPLQGCVPLPLLQYPPRYTCPDYILSFVLSRSSDVLAQLGNHVVALATSRTINAANQSRKPHHLRNPN